MAIIKGQMQLIDDIGEAIRRIDPTTKCILIGNDLGTSGYQNFCNAYGIITASTLMPDYAGLEADLNGSVEELRAKYFPYLATEEPRMFIATLIAAMYQGRNIILLVPPEYSKLRYPTLLMEYLYTYHGIQTMFKNVPFAYNKAFDVYNADCMYACNIIGPAEYLMVAGPGFDMVDKLCYDTQMQFQPNTSKEQIKQYFEEWRKKMMQSGTATTKPIGFMQPTGKVV